MTLIKEEVILLNPEFKKSVNFIFRMLEEKGLSEHEKLFLRKFTTSKQLFFVFYTIEQYHEILSEDELYKISRLSGINMRIEREKILSNKIEHSSEAERQWQDKLGQKAGLTHRQRSIYVRKEYTADYMAVLRKLILKNINESTLNLLTQQIITCSYQKEIVAIYKIDSEGWNSNKSYLLDPLIDLDKLIEFRQCIKAKIPDSLLSTWKELKCKEIKDKRYEYLRKVTEEDEINT